MAQMYTNWCEALSLPLEVHVPFHADSGKKTHDLVRSTLPQSGSQGTLPNKNLKTDIPNLSVVKCRPDASFAHELVRALSNPPGATKYENKRLLPGSQKLYCWRETVSANPTSTKPLLADTAETCAFPHAGLSGTRAGATLTLSLIWDATNSIRTKYKNRAFSENPRMHLRPRSPAEHGQVRSNLRECKLHQAAP